nr:hypothetical protein [Tanacetum cinerariifolium]
MLMRFLSKVLDRLAYDKSISDQMVFMEGVNDSDNTYSSSGKNSSYCLIYGNDGSFINNPIEHVVSSMEVNVNGMVNKEGGCEGIVDPLLVSNNTSKLNMDDVEHVKDESIRKANNDRRDNGVKERELQMKFVPQFVYTQSNETKRIAISVEDIKKGSEACALQLYGYFVGTSVDYKVVNANLSRMWMVYGIADITKTSVVLFYFKFKNEEGMKVVLESGPWMINNVPLLLNVWEPGIWLEKVEPSTIPIWVCVYGIPMELCNGNEIGKIMSEIGKPMLMDNLTRERCLKKAGKLDFARVLVEVSASDVLPQTLEIEYPAIGDRPRRVGDVRILIIEEAHATKYSIFPEWKSSIKGLRVYCNDLRYVGGKITMEFIPKLPKKSSRYDALYGRRKYKSPVLLAEIGESKMIGLEMEQETTRVVMIKERVKEAKDHQERIKLIVGNQTFKI